MKRLLPKGANDTVKQLKKTRKKPVLLFEFHKVPMSCRKVLRISDTFNKVPMSLVKVISAFNEFNEAPK